MAVAEWDCRLPIVPLSSGFEDALGDNVIKFQPDVGSPLLRKRASFANDDVSVSFHLDCEQRQYMEAFYKKNAALPFYMRNFYGGAKPYKQKFQFDSPPVFVKSGVVDGWLVSFKLKRVT